MKVLVKEAQHSARGGILVAKYPYCPLSTGPSNENYFCNR